MSKRLLKRFLGRVIERGTLSMTFADGEVVTMGQAESGFPDVALRLTDRKVPRDILLDPRLGAAEAYMDGRLQLTRGGIMELIQLLRSNAPFERGGQLRAPSLAKRLRNRAAFAMGSVNNSVGSKRNVAHHYDIGNDLYRLMLDPEHMQYSCAYWPEERGGTDMSLAQAQEVDGRHVLDGPIALAREAHQDGVCVRGVGHGGRELLVQAVMHMVQHGPGHRSLAVAVDKRIGPRDHVTDQVQRLRRADVRVSVQHGPDQVRAGTLGADEKDHRGVGHDFSLLSGLSRPST